MSLSRRTAVCMAVLLAGAGIARAQATAGDSLISPVFRGDSTKTGVIRAVEAGAVPGARDSLRTDAGRSDSLLAKLRRRGPYIGISAGAAFAEHSARDRFSGHMNTRAAADSQRILQRQDPVHVFFPGGLLIGYPVATHFDLMLRTEHIYYRVTGLSQKDNDAPSEFWYSTQAHLAGAGVRWLVPVSLLTVTGQPGLYAAYTHFWNFGPTGMRSPDGSLRARTDPAGAGYEIQIGFQQDFDRRWAFTGGLSFSRLAFRSDADWNTVVPTSLGPAEWTLGSLRFTLQGLYQFGR